MQKWAKRMDIYGIFGLDANEAKDIEDLVYYTNGEVFLSRNLGYYSKDYSLNQKEISQDRKKLSKRLMNANTEIEMAVIADHMLKLSGDVTYHHLKYSAKDRDNQYEECKACLDEDVARYLDLMDGKQPRQIEYDLPIGDERIHTKGESQNNFKIIKMFLESLPPEVRDTLIITSGYGGFYIGPSAKHLLGTDYYSLNYSGHKNKDNTRENISLDDFINADYYNHIISTKPDITILEDDICSGNTAKRLSKLFTENGMSVKVGATECDYKSLFEFDYLSPLPFTPRTDINVFRYDNIHGYESNQSTRDYHLISPNNEKYYSFYKKIQSMNSLSDLKLHTIVFFNKMTQKIEDNKPEMKFNSFI